MKVTKISTSDYARGGGAAMYRLHVGLRKFGIDCKILSAIKTLESTESENSSVTKIRVWIGENTSNLGTNNIHCVGSFKVRKMDFT